MARNWANPIKSWWLIGRHHHTSAITTVRIGLCGRRQNCTQHRAKAQATNPTKSIDTIEWMCVCGIVVDRRQVAECRFASDTATHTADKRKKPLRWWLCTWCFNCFSSARPVCLNRTSRKHSPPSSIDRSVLRHSIACVLLSVRMSVVGACENYRFSCWTSPASPAKCRYYIFIRPNPQSSEPQPPRFHWLPTKILWICFSYCFVSVSACWYTCIY